MLISTKFENIGKARQLTSGLPYASLVEIEARHPKNNAVLVKVQKHRGVFNSKSGDVAALVSPHYKIIQHHEFFTSCLNILMNFGGDFEGFVRTDRKENEVMLDVFFKDRHVKDNSEEGINLGFRMTNSYNCSRVASATFFGYRHKCDNGMVFGFNNKGMICQKHHGDITLFEKNLGNFFNRMMEQHKTIQDAVLHLIDRQERFDDLYEIAFFRERYDENIYNRIKKTTMEEDYHGGEYVSVWSFYNAITSMATHNSRTLSKESYIQNKALKILNHFYNDHTTRKES